MPDNILYYGDNLDILRLHVKDESVDLIYADPPLYTPTSAISPGTFCVRFTAM